jgi:hypothetical protein
MSPGDAPPAPGAIVVRRQADQALLKSLFPGWEIVLPLTAVCGRQWNRIVMLWAPMNENEARWVSEQLQCRLVEGARLEWLT